MQQPIAARQNVDKGSELGDVHDFALVDSTHLGQRRVEDGRDPPTSLFDGTAILGSDGHGANHAVIVHGDIGAGLLLESVDHLALGPDDLTDLVHGDLERDDLWCR